MKTKDCGRAVVWAAKVPVLIVMAASMAQRYHVRLEWGKSRERERGGEGKRERES